MCKKAVSNNKRIIYFYVCMAARIRVIYHSLQKNFRLDISKSFLTIKLTKH